MHQLSDVLPPGDREAPPIGKQGAAAPDARALPALASEPRRRRQLCAHSLSYVEPGAPTPLGKPAHVASSEESPAAANVEDLELVSRILRQDPAALEEMGRRLACLLAMLRFQSRRLGASLSEHELEEIAQDTVVALWSKLATFKGLSTLETWAFRFATLEILKVIQRRARRPAPARTIDEDNDPAIVLDPDNEPSIGSADLLAGLESLEPTTARLIRRRHHDEASFDDIAASEGLPLNTVKARYYRGLARLREHLERRLKRGERS
jgi:RNA polymerase sigma-70 factor, ECF subfamily